MIGAGGAVTLALAMLLAQGPHAAAKHKRAPAPAAKVVERKAQAPARADVGGGKRSGDAATGGAESAATASSEPPDGAEGGAVGATKTKTAKTKVYSFGAMDVEGKLKTPQLLYFLNRVKLELEMSAPDHRSFMKELAKTADDPSL